MFSNTLGAIFCQKKYEQRLQNQVSWFCNSNWQLERQRNTDIRKTDKLCLDDNKLMFITKRVTKHVDIAYSENIANYITKYG